MDEIPPKTHDLIKLAKLSGIYFEMSEFQRSFLEILLPLNIEARYPDYKDNIGKKLPKEKSANIITETERFLCWIKEQL